MQNLNEIVVINKNDPKKFDFITEEYAKKFDKTINQITTNLEGMLVDNCTAFAFHIGTGSMIANVTDGELALLPLSVIASIFEDNKNK